jgi:alkylhydroperoxidase family enzyme
MFLDVDYEFGPFSDAEKAVLALADEMVLTNQEGRLTDAQRAALAEHFPAEQVFELGMTAAVLTGMAKFLFVFDLVTREDSCPIVRPEGAPGERPH